jgi:hypothetical protein
MNGRDKRRQGCELTKTVSAASFHSTIYGISTLMTILMNSWRFGPMMVLIEMVFVSTKAVSFRKKIHSKKLPVLSTIIYLPLPYFSLGQFLFIDTGINLKNILNLVLSGL